MASTIEHIFNRALNGTFSKKKFLFVFPVLLICGLLMVFCRSMTFEANQWITLNLGFLPFLLSSGILLATGVILGRLYSSEVRGAPLELKKVLSQSIELVVGVSYLSFPPLLVYLCLWIVMGIFYLLKEIPGIGPGISVLFSFGPFLLVCGSLSLCLFSLLVLFFVTPHLALKKDLGIDLAKEIYTHVKSNPSRNSLLFIIGLLPLLFVLGFLSLAAVMTGLHYSVPANVLSVSLQWFFIMVPFTAILTPTVIFFFNFSTESCVLIRRSLIKQEEKCESLS